ncbi:hypothetical protein Q2K21_21670 [Streptomyces sp. CGMCC 4.7035]|uniref:hypothetical protein n=1 Tax=Streptomyces sp. CGMCC 4.7035 TaxID=3061628 RepID=UPI00287309FF|nr:hypothetical protein [Streptomyces sp. CGMCC 4.7035]WNC00455.1 hypothetical protein Q2K21_21670 [Streptomyces sp. CGMCC 4.7035]
MTAGAFLRAKQHTTVAIQFLHWLGQRGRQLGECTQHDVDAWFGAGTTTRQHANNFLYWAIRQRLVRHLTVPVPTNRTSPLTSEQEHLDAVRTLLLHDSLPAAHRAIGLMLVLFGQPLAQIVKLRTDQLRDGPDGLQVTFGSDWVNFPEPAATVIRVHLAARPGLSTAANPTSQLLFPGFMPGRPMHIYSVSNRLRTLGIRPLATRSRSWLQMVREAPPSVLADRLGHQSQDSDALRGACRHRLPRLRGPEASLQTADPQRITVATSHPYAPSHLGNGRRTRFYGRCRR